MQRRPQTRAEQRDRAQENERALAQGEFENAVNHGVVSRKRIEELPGRIPKGFRRTAQGCEERATLGCVDETVNPNGVVARRSKHDTTPLGLKTVRLETQGSSFLATLG